MQPCLLPDGKLTAALRWERNPAGRPV